MATTPSQPKPSLATALLVPLALWVLTAIVGGIFFALGIARIPAAVDDLQRAPLGERTDIELEAGDYRVFLEGNGINDEYLTPGALFGLTGPDGQEVPVALYGSSSLTYDVSGHEGRAAWTFTAPEDGTYSVLATSEDSVVDGVAMGQQNPVTAGVGRILVGVAVGTVGFLVALVVMIILLVKRGRSKRQAFAAAAPAPTYGAPPPGPWGAGPL